MSEPVYIGLAVTSHYPGAYSTAEFSNVAMTGNVTGSWQVAAIGADRQPGNSPDKLYVVVEDSAGKAATVTDPALVNAAAWTEWKIPLSSFGVASRGKVKNLYIGVGDKTSPAAGGSGAQPIWPTPTRQVTQAGAHSMPGTQNQPRPSSQSQRP